VTSAAAAGRRSWHGGGLGAGRDAGHQPHDAISGHEGRVPCWGRERPRSRSGQDGRALLEGESEACAGGGLDRGAGRASRGAGCRRRRWG